MKNSESSDGNTSDNNEQNDANTVEIKPEVIRVENLEDYEEPSELNFEELKKINESKHGVLVRVICFVAAICCLLFSLGIMAYTAFILFLVMICLFRNQSLNQTFYSFLKLFVNSFVLSIGFALAVLSPTIGIGFMILYFTLKGVKSDRDALSSTINKYF